MIAAITETSRVGRVSTSTRHVTGGVWAHVTESQQRTFHGIKNITPLPDPTRNPNTADDDDDDHWPGTPPNVLPITRHSIESFTPFNVLLIYHPPFVLCPAKSFSF
jgi:hypothetical protein